MNKKSPSIVVSLLVAAALAGTCTVAFAQNLATASHQGVPRAADGRPDLSGIWRKDSVNDSLKGSDDVPFTPAGRERFEAAKNEVDPIAICVFPGVPRVMNVTGPFQIVQVPGKVIFLYEALHGFRIVPTDGRGHREGWAPALMGDSVGRWEGDVLIVETVNLTDRTRLDKFGNVHSEEARVTERYQLIDRDTLAFDYTVDDPKFYTRPLTAAQRLIPRAPPDWELMEYACTDFNKVVEDGLLGPGGNP